MLKLQPNWKLTHPNALQIQNKKPETVQATIKTPEQTEDGKDNCQIPSRTPRNQKNHRFEEQQKNIIQQSHITQTPIAEDFIYRLDDCRVWSKMGLRLRYHQLALSSGSPYFLDPMGQLPTKNN